MHVKIPFFFVLVFNCKLVHFIKKKKKINKSTIEDILIFNRSFSFITQKKCCNKPYVKEEIYIYAERRHLRFGGKKRKSE